MDELITWLDEQMIKCEKAQEAFVSQSSWDTATAQKYEILVTVRASFLLVKRKIEEITRE